jgi:surface antigen
MPNLDAKEYTNIQINPLAGRYKGQCTWYAFGRAYEVSGGRAIMPFKTAKTWYDLTSLPKGQELRDNCVVVYDYGKNGHVAFVEKYDTVNQKVTISESNWGSSLKVETKTLDLDYFLNRPLDQGKGSKIAGYIYLD